MFISVRKAGLIILFFALTSKLAASEYDVDKSKKNLVKFTSDAKIENFDGTTDHIDGYFYYEGDSTPEKSALDKSAVYFEVDLRTLDTGIGLRNRHMREDYLETDKYPKAVFKGKFTRVQPAQNGSFDLTVQGEMKIHGISRMITVSGKLTPSEGNGYRITGKFDIKLPDYNIPIPQLMFLKISEIMKMELDFFTRKTK